MLLIKGLGKVFLTPFLLIALLVMVVVLFVWELVSPEGITYDEWLRGKRRF